MALWRPVTPLSRCPTHLITERQSKWINNAFVNCNRLDLFHRKVCSLPGLPSSPAPLYAPFLFCESILAACAFLWAKGLINWIIWLINSKENEERKEELIFKCVNFVLVFFLRHWQFVYYFTGKNTGKLRLMLLVCICICARPLPLGLMSCKLSSHIRGFQNAFNNAWPHSVWVSPRDKHARSSSVRRAKKDRQTASLPVPACVWVCVLLLERLLWHSTGRQATMGQAAPTQARFYCLPVIFVWLLR